MVLWVLLVFYLVSIFCSGARLVYLYSTIPIAYVSKLRLFYSPVLIGSVRVTVLELLPPHTYDTIKALYSACIQYCKVCSIEALACTCFSHKLTSWALTSPSKLAVKSDGRFPTVRSIANSAIMNYVYKSVAFCDLHILHARG